MLGHIIYADNETVLAAHSFSEFLSPSDALLRSTKGRSEINCALAHVPMAEGVRIQRDWDC